MYLSSEAQVLVSYPPGCPQGEAADAVPDVWGADGWDAPGASGDVSPVWDGEVAHRDSPARAVCLHALPNPADPRATGPKARQTS
jgi:hypothetical protein